MKSKGITSDTYNVDRKKYIKNDYFLRCPSPIFLANADLALA